MRVRTCLFLRDRANCKGIAPRTGVALCEQHRRGLALASVDALRSNSTVDRHAQDGAFALLDVLTPKRRR